MSQLSRLISILTLLRSKRILTASELAERFNISVRTVYRDIRKLEEAGVPVFPIEGSGYSLMDGYKVAPVQFTEKQANALITAQHLVKQSKDASLVNDYEEALVKIKSVFKSSIQMKTEHLSNKLVIFPTHKDQISSNALSEIQLAITNFNLIEIKYSTVIESKESFRKIEPCAIYSADNKWILIAWCHLRNDFRAFRIDRIRHFKILVEKFEDRQFDLQTYFATKPYKMSNSMSANIGCENNSGN